MTVIPGHRAQTRPCVRKRGGSALLLFLPRAETVGSRAGLVPWVGGWGGRAWLVFHEVTLLDHGAAPSAHKGVLGSVM